MKCDSTKADVNSFPVEALGPFPAACVLAPGGMKGWGEEFKLRAQ